jgi:hypothetical protein
VPEFGGAKLVPERVHVVVGDDQVPVVGVNNQVVGVNNQVVGLGGQGREQVTMYRGCSGSDTHDGEGGAEEAPLPSSPCRSNFGSGSGSTDDCSLGCTDSRFRGLRLVGSCLGCRSQQQPANVTPPLLGVQRDQVGGPAVPRQPVSCGWSNHVHIHTTTVNPALSVDKPHHVLRC